MSALRRSPSGSPAKQGGGAGEEHPQLRSGGLRQHLPLIIVDDTGEAVGRVRAWQPAHQGVGQFSIGQVGQFSTGVDKQAENARHSQMAVAVVRTGTLTKPKRPSLSAWSNCSSQRFASSSGTPWPMAKAATILAAHSA